MPPRRRETTIWTCTTYCNGWPWSRGGSQDWAPQHFITGALHHRADAPRNEFLVTQPLGAGTTSRRRLQYQIEDLAPYFLHGALAIGNRAGVDVHVVRHPAVGIAVGGDLHHRNRGKTDGAAPPRGEGDQIASSRRESGERDRIVTRSVHEDESRRRHSFRVLVHFHQRRGAAFRHRAQRFLDDVGQSACLVPGAGIVVEAAAVEAADVALVLANAGQQFLS